jgi:hypothetical protein
MKMRDLLTIATAALGTATLTVVAFWAGPMDAGDDADAPPPKIAQARLVTRGVELTLAGIAGRTFKTGERPEFALTARNTTPQMARISFCVSMTATAVADPTSRTIRLPSVLWEQQQSLTLNANETKTLTLCASTNLPPRSLISVSLREPHPGAAPVAPGIAIPNPSAVTVLNFTTAPARALPTVASSP